MPGKRLGHYHRITSTKVLFLIPSSSFRASISRGQEKLICLVRLIFVGIFFSSWFSLSSIKSIFKSLKWGFIKHMITLCYRELISFSRLWDSSVRLDWWHYEDVLFWRLMDSSQMSYRFWEHPLQYFCTHLKINIPPKWVWHAHFGHTELILNISSGCNGACWTVPEGFSRRWVQRYFIMKWKFSVFC